MKLRDRIIPWRDRTIEEQRSECESQILVTYVREARAEWVRVYTYLAYDLIQEFGEDAVLDTLEEAMWDMHYDAGLTWREEFGNDAQSAIEGISGMWAGGCKGCTDSVKIAEKEPGRWDLMIFNCLQRDVALELDRISGRKIILALCMGDMAAAMGWASNLRLDLANVQLRGDSFCYQIYKAMGSDADKFYKGYSKELSEEYGWRSIKKLEGGE